MTTYTGFTLVCIFPNGQPHRAHYHTLDDARRALVRAEESGRFASGSIYNDDDNEIDGFAADGGGR